MIGFEDVNLSYNGASYVIPKAKVLMAVAEIEDALRGTGTKSALEVLFQPGGPSFSRLAMAYSVALRAAGAAVSADEIYIKMQQGLANGDATEIAQQAQGAVLALVAMISPPMAMAMGSDEGDASGEAEAAG